MTYKLNNLINPETDGNVNCLGGVYQRSCVPRTISAEKVSHDALF